MTRQQRPEAALPPCYAMVLPGLEEIADDEITRDFHGDVRKTGGLYGIVDVMDVSPAKDNEWYVEHITVKGKHVVVRVNGKVTVDYTEPEGVKREGQFVGRLIDKGTFAFQGHDPESVVRFRNIWVKPLD